MLNMEVTLTDQNGSDSCSAHPQSETVHSLRTQKGNEVHLLP